MISHQDLESGRKYQPLEKELGDLQVPLLLELQLLARLLQVLLLAQVLLLEPLRSELVLELLCRDD